MPESRKKSCQHNGVSATHNSRSVAAKDNCARASPRNVVSMSAVLLCELEQMRHEYNSPSCLAVPEVAWKLLGATTKKDRLAIPS